MYSQTSWRRLAKGQGTLQDLPVLLPTHSVSDVLFKHLLHFKFTVAELLSTVHYTFQCYYYKLLQAV